jgi:hypothetical protein
MASTITNVTPGAGGVNKIITILGTEFGANREQSKVIFKQGDYEFEAAITGWSDTQIKCYTPEIRNLGTWDIVVRIVSNV